MIAVHKYSTNNIDGANNDVTESRLDRIETNNHKAHRLWLGGTRKAMTAMFLQLPTINTRMTTCRIVTNIKVGRMKIMKMTITEMVAKY